MEAKIDDVSERQLHLNRRSINRDIIRKFKKKQPAIKNKRLRKVERKLTSKLTRMEPDVHLQDFTQTPEMVVEIMAIYCKCFKLPMPQEILQLILVYVTPRLLRINPRQGVVFINCHGVNVKLRGKGKHLHINNCSNFTIEVEDLISSMKIFDSDRLDVMTVGEIGVHAYAMEKSSDVKIRFRDDTAQTVFTNVSPKGPIRAAAFVKGEDCVDFNMLHSLRISDEVSATRWSKLNGWQSISPATGEWLTIV